MSHVAPGAPDLHATSKVAQFRKFLPQLAYVLLAGWTLIADRLDDNQAIDGVTILAVVMALAQAVAVVWPSHPDVKAGASLVAALGQGVTAAWSDHVITLAEWTILVSAFLAWAAGAAVTNHPPGPPDPNPEPMPDVPDELTPDKPAQDEG